MESPQLTPSHEKGCASSNGNSSPENDGTRSLATAENGNYALEKPGENTAEDAPTEVRNVHGFKWLLIVIAILSSIFVYSLDNTIVADIVPAISSTFDSNGLLPWLSVGFMIGGVAVVLPFGKLFTLYNAKQLYVASSVLFLAASALCGGAPSMSAMIVGRVFAGAGGNGMYLGVLTLLSVNTNDQERPAYLSLVGLVWGIGTVLGPVVGGAFELFNWRWAFYINLIICGVFAPVYLFMIPGFDPSPNIPIRKRAAKFDYLGAILSIGFFITFVMAVNFGFVLYPWDSGQIIALFVLTGVLIAAFGVQQVFAWGTTQVDRLFPLHFLKNKEAILLFVCSAACNTAGFVTIYYIPIYFQFTRGDSALKAAVRLLPLICVLSASILANGVFMSKLGYYQPWYIIGSVLTVIGGALMTQTTADTSTAHIYGYEILIGVGTGMFIQAGYAVIQAVVDPADMGYAISFMMIAQLGGIAIGLSISGAVFINRAHVALTSVLPNIPSDQITEAISGTSGAFFQALSDSTRKLAIEALVHSLSKVFIPVAVGGGTALVASAFLNRKKAFLTTAAGA